MSSKTLVMIGMFVGSIAGGYVPMLFGADMFSALSILGSGVGGILGIYLGYKLSNF